MPTLVTVVAMFPVLVIVRVTAAVLPTTVLGKRMTPLVTGENVRFAPCPVPDESYGKVVTDQELGCKRTDI